MAQFCQFHDCIAQKRKQIQLKRSQKPSRNKMIPLCCSPSFASVFNDNRSQKMLLHFFKLASPTFASQQRAPLPLPLPFPLAFAFPFAFSLTLVLALALALSLIVRHSIRLDSSACDSRSIERRRKRALADLASDWQICGRPKWLKNALNLMDCKSSVHFAYNSECRRAYRDFE